jgi:hypothetical protein
MLCVQPECVPVDLDKGSTLAGVAQTDSKRAALRSEKSRRV